MQTLIRLMGLLAGVLGAAGVAAAALASHGGYSDSLRIASEFALIHAVLVIAVMRYSSRAAPFAAGVTLLGALLFCGDLALRAIASHALAPMAAPTGGFLMIAGWLVSGFTAFSYQRPK